ncbi:MAG: VanZ family protein [Butyricicoccaceae bacterium]
MSKRFFTAAAVLWTGFIFYHSLQSGEASAQASGRMLALLNTLLGWLPLTLTDHIVRKCAHFFEFSVLGFLLYGSCADRRRIPLFGILIPCADELIQLFSDGRSSQLSDVLLDCSGVLFGVLCFAAARALMIRWQAFHGK